MNLPIPLVIKYLSDYCIIHFKDTSYVRMSPPHFYVNIPIDDTSSVLLCIITSQAENRRKSYARHKGTLESLVVVDKDILPFLSEEKESIIDCNNPHLIEKTKLSERIDPEIGIFVKQREIPDSLKERILSAITNSPLVQPDIKAMIKSSILQ